jgi:hypothetical protein
MGLILQVNQPVAIRRIVPNGIPLPSDFAGGTTVPGERVPQRDAILKDVAHLVRRDSTPLLPTQRKMAGMREPTI